MPRSVRHLPPQDIDVAILGADLIKRIARTIPLVQDFLDRVVTFVESKTNRPLVCLPSGIAIYFELHFPFMLVRTILRTKRATLQAVHQDCRKVEMDRRGRSQLFPVYQSAGRSLSGEYNPAERFIHQPTRRQSNSCSADSIRP
jgi:hypothetical protein